jgi:prevent-host-death family protein
MKVGIRELKARLSEYIERAQQGQVIDVTSRGRRVAQIVPAPGPDNVERGLAEGWISRREDRPPEPVEAYRPRAGTPSTTELIRSDRDA